MQEQYLDCGIEFNIKGALLAGLLNEIINGGEVALQNCTPQTVAAQSSGIIFEAHN